MTLQCGYFFAKRMATWEAIKPAPPVINTFFGSYGISLSLSFFYDDVFAFSQKDGFKFAVLTDLFFRAALFFLFDAKKSQTQTESVSLEKQRKRLPPLYFKNTFCAPRRANCIIDYSFLVLNKQ
mmetsp:Transcript_7261/g.24063  ORF Transcript_7261/g.24063 Transcript_7261/m.24063 type:complete len:124 (-) Transcript_7261:2373-2744(-)